MRGGNANKDIPLVAYGDMLFDSPQIFGEPARTFGIACSTCHNRSDLNDPTIATALNEVADKLDAIKVAILTDDWQEVATLYDEYYAMVEA